MTRNYTEIVDLIRAVALDAADVSGFGLSGSLSSLGSRNKCDLRIKLNNDLFINPKPDLISCLHSDQPTNVQCVHEELITLINQREVSGPLILMVPMDGNSIVNDFNMLGLSSSIIGSFVAGTGQVEVSI